MTWWRMRLQRLMVWVVRMGLDGLHVLHMLWRGRVLVVMMVMLLRLNVLVVWMLLALLLLMLVLIGRFLLCALRGLWLGCDGANASFGSSLGGLLCSQRGFALLDCAGHVAICPAA